MLAMEEGVVTEDDIHAELGEVVAGVEPGRTAEDEITLFDSGGTGIETVAGAALLYERAVAEDLGTTIDIAPASEALTGKE
jgi:alanine dehydrogenase